MNSRRLIFKHLNDREEIRARYHESLDAAVKRRKADIPLSMPYMVRRNALA